MVDSISLSSCPGSRNIKPDALSRQFTADSANPEPDPILPPTCIVAMVTWEIESRVRQEQQSQPDPGNGPLNKLFVPNSDVLQWVHSTHLTCHPGLNRTLTYLRQRFWWATMEKDTCEFVLACPVCAQSTTSAKPTSGLLHPLPIPGHT